MEEVDRRKEYYMDNKFFNLMQRFGRTFMLPIALLPIAGLFLGVGASITGQDFVNRYGLQNVLGEGTVLHGVLSILTDAGDVIFGNLPLLFAVAVALGFARASKEVAALSAVVGYFVMYRTIASTLMYFGDIEALSQINGLVTNALGIENTLNMGVFGGIIIGFVVAWLHNKYYRIRFIDALSFFAGTHFVPIISAVAGVILGVIFAFVWPFIGSGIATLGEWIGQAGLLGGFFYGYVYRILIPFGLHHVFYLPFWQTALGGVETVAGQVVQGAQNIVFAQLRAGEVISPMAARYFSFMYPFMIGGFPAAALAMYHTAYEDRKEDVRGLLTSSSLTTILTGITEPLEFSILFASPFLYFGVHGILAGLAVIISQVLNVGVGVTFSGGFIDFLLYGILPGQSQTHWMNLLIPIVVYAALYYFIFRWAIVKFDLKTPGREAGTEESRLHTKDEYRESIGMNQKEEGAPTPSASSAEDERSSKILQGLGGLDNLDEYTSCATRLRVTVNDPAKVDQTVLRATGAAGIMQQGKSVQVIYGPTVSNIKTDLDDYIERQQ